MKGKEFTSLVLLSTFLFLTGCEERNAVYFEEGVKFNVTGNSADTTASPDKLFTAMNAEAKDNTIKIEHCPGQNRPCDVLELVAANKPPKPPGCICNELNILYKGNARFEVTGIVKNASIPFTAKQSNANILNTINTFKNKELNLRR